MRLLDSPPDIPPESPGGCAYGAAAQGTLLGRDQTCTPGRQQGYQGDRHEHYGYGLFHLLNAPTLLYPRSLRYATSRRSVIPFPFLGEGA